MISTIIKALNYRPIYQKYGTSKIFQAINPFLLHVNYLPSKMVIDGNINLAFK